MTGALSSRGRGRPSAQEALRRHDASLEIASEEFATKGYSGASIRAIASRAGISTRTLYSWYRDKPGLFAACLEHCSREIQVPAAPASTNLRHELIAYAVAMQDHLLTERSVKLASLIYRDGVEFPALRQIAKDQFQRFQVDPVAAVLIRHGIEPGLARRLAPHFVVLALGEWQRRTLFGGPLPNAGERQEQAELATLLFLNGAEALIGEMV